MSEIEMKVNEELKPLKELCEKITEVVKSEVSKGFDDVDTKELGYAIDMIKDLADAKAKTVEACYHTYILKAMEENEEDYGETWDEKGRIKGYSSSMHPRNAKTGRFIKSYVPDMYYDEMPHMMAYEPKSRYDMSKKAYMDSKSTDDKQIKARELDKFMNDLTMDMKELVQGMSAEEKTIWKHKIQKLNDMVQ